MMPVIFPLTKRKCAVKAQCFHCSWTKCDATKFSRSYCSSYQKNYF